MTAKRSSAGWPYLAVFIALGMSLSLLGPALTFLRGRAHASTGEIGVLFIAQSLGYLVGSLASGRLYDRGVGHHGVAAGLLGIAAASLVIPHVSSVAMLAIPVALVGLFGACIDVGGNTLVVWHSRRTGSIRLLNGLHLFFGIGALLVPGLVNRSLAWSSGLTLVTTVIAVYAALVAVVVLAHQAPESSTPAGSDPDAPQTPTRILAVIGVFFFLYVGVEIGFSGWITTYAEGIHLPGINAPTWLNTVFWLSFTLGRVFAVVL
ncbi:MAG: family sugar transporter, partial [Ilumatobacteraceae bacterium]|nr:family sugar transporter [Ilumatobacteraceae bacterium]